MNTSARKNHFYNLFPNFSKYINLNKCMSVFRYWPVYLNKISSDSTTQIRFPPSGYMQVSLTRERYENDWTFLVETSGDMENLHCLSLLRSFSFCFSTEPMEAMLWWIFAAQTTAFMLSAKGKVCCRSPSLSLSATLFEWRIFHDHSTRACEHLAQVCFEKYIWPFAVFVSIMNQRRRLRDT